VTVDAWAFAKGEAHRAVKVEVAALFDAHYLSLCRLAYVLLGDRARAEDVVQEAFLRTFAGWGRLRQPALAHVYLRKAVLNQCRSGLRRRSTETQGNTTVAAEERTRVDNSFDDDRALRLAVVAAVRRLPGRQRDTVVLRYYLDLGEAEIAQTLGVTVGTVKSQLAKARHNLATKGGLRGETEDG
jgi:RNA polymerase sigma-70 factor (sigma-E family)